MEIQNRKIIETLNIVIGKLESIAQKNSEVAYCAGMLTAIGKVIEEVNIEKVGVDEKKEKIIVR